MTETQKTQADDRLIRDLFGKRRRVTTPADDIEADILYSIEVKKDERFPALAALHRETNGKGEKFWTALHTEVRRIQREQRLAYINKERTKQHDVFNV